MFAQIRPYVRVAVVIAMTALAIFIFLPDIIAPWKPWGSFGFEAAATGRITTIFPGMAADRAGLRIGDRFDLVAIHDRAAERAIGAFSPGRPGKAASFAIKQPDGSDRNVTLVAAPFARSVADNITDVVAMLAELAFVIIPCVLVIVRPSTLTWAFFLYAVGSVPYSLVLAAYMPQDVADATRAYVPFAQTFSAFGFAAFALLFPKERASGWHRRALYILTAAMMVVIAISFYRLGMSFTDPAHWKVVTPIFDTSRWIYTVALYSLAIVFFAVNYYTARPAERPRLRWVIGGFIVGYAGDLIIATYQGLPWLSVSPPVWVFNILSTFSLLAPISVAYAIMKHRVIDVRFFLSRALVYGLITTVAVAVLALLDWAVARQLEESKLGILVEIGGAVLVGLGIHRVHGAIDRFVDRYVFRSVHDAEQHFTTVGRAMMYAQSMRAIDALLTEESARALHLTGSTVYHAHENGGFAKTSASGSPMRDAFDHDDRVVLHLLAERTPIERDGELAVPFMVRDRLLGFALFGSHTNSTAIDPNERQLLETFCHSASNAYDHVMGEERADENQRLRGELALMQARYEEVRSLVSVPRDTLHPM